MKKWNIGFLILIAIAVVTLPSKASATATGNINLLMGRKSLDSKWDPGTNPDPEITEQGEFGLLFDFRPNEWPVNLALDFLGAKSDDIGWTIKTSEVDFGFRKYFGDSASGTPYLGGGLAHIYAKEDFPNGTSQDDSAGGAWVGGGVVFNPAKHFNLGLDIRYSNALVRLSPANSIKAGGIHTGLIAGYKF